MFPDIVNYKIDKVIGSGGMGVVYLAEHTMLSRQVAIKVLLNNHVSNDEVRARFIMEAEFLDKLSHPNIVKLHDFQIEPIPCIIMEYIKGSSLEHMIGKEVGPIPWERALPIFEQIVKGIGYAHSQGIIHRDIKPSNILLTSDSVVKITDLGIAKIIGQKGLTKTGTNPGTVCYMAPEQVKGEQLDERSDIYSLGLTLYEMLSGTLPFEEGETTEFILMSNIVNRTTSLDPRKHYPHIPQWLVSVVGKATAPLITDRYQSCTEFLKALSEKTDHTSFQTIREDEPVNSSDIFPKYSEHSLKQKRSKIPMIIGTVFAILFVIFIVVMSNDQSSIHSIGRSRTIYEDSLIAPVSSSHMVSSEEEVAAYANSFFSDLENIAAHNSGSVEHYLTSDVFIGFDSDFPNGNSFDQDFFNRCFNETSSIELISSITPSNVLMNGSSTASISYQYRSYDNDGESSWQIMLGMRKQSGNWHIDRYSFFRI